MKNFKLLLGATALLSTGALLANATTPVGTLTGESVLVPVNAEVVKAYSLSATPLNFGKVVFSSDPEYPTTVLAVEVDENGVTAIDDIGSVEGKGNASAYVLTQGAAGLVTGATCDQLIYPGSDNPEEGGQFNLTTRPAGATSNLDSHIDSLKCKTVDGKSVFYGRFMLEDIAQTEILPGTYSGSFEVTVISTIYDNEATASGD